MLTSIYILAFNIYGKRNDISFNLINFTNFSSCSHVSIYRNILLNHCLHVKRSCSSHYIRTNLSNLKQVAMSYNYPPCIYFIMDETSNLLDWTHDIHKNYKIFKKVYAFKKYKIYKKYIKIIKLKILL